MKGQRMRSVGKSKGLGEGTYNWHMSRVRGHEVGARGAAQQALPGPPQPLPAYTSSPPCCSVRNSGLSSGSRWTSAISSTP